jgi:sugar-phosphatase
MSLVPTERRVEAVLFDMDGTLILSEDRTDRAVLALLAEHQITAPSDFDLSDFHGVTWATSARSLTERWPALEGGDVAGGLQRHFHQTFITDPPPVVPGAVEALTAAASSFPVAIVTSSNRETLELVCQQLQLMELLSTTVGAEDCSESKPSPEPFLVGAKRLGVSPQRCLIFEDSSAGVEAGLASGASVIAIGSASGHEPSIADYTTLPEAFFSALAHEGHG